MYSYRYGSGFEVFMTMMMGPLNTFESIASLPSSRTNGKISLFCMLLLSISYASCHFHQSIIEFLFTSVMRAANS